MHVTFLPNCRVLREANIGASHDARLVLPTIGVIMLKQAMALPFLFGANVNHFVKSFGPSSQKVILRTSIKHRGV